MRTQWTYETSGNGAFVTITAPDGRTAFLQGDDAARFIKRANTVEAVENAIDESIAALCMEYESVLS